MKISQNQFIKDVPSKSSVVFSNDDPAKSANTFSSDKPTKSNFLMEGDNTSGGAFINDTAFFGEGSGGDRFGGFVHFKNRPAQTAIVHR